MKLNTEEQINIAINSLSTFISRISAPSVDKNIAANDPRWWTLKSSLSAAIKEIFGTNSDELNEFSEMKPQIPESGITKLEEIELRKQQREYMRAVAVELISRLQDKIQSIRLASTIQKGYSPVDGNTGDSKNIEPENSNAQNCAVNSTCNKGQCCFQSLRKFCIAIQNMLISIDNFEMKSKTLWWIFVGAMATIVGGLILKYFK